METINITELRAAKAIAEQKITDALIEFGKSTGQVVDRIQIINQEFGNSSRHFIRATCEVDIKI